jgi:hypothetical protein
MDILKPQANNEILFSWESHPAAKNPFSIVILIFFLILISCLAMLVTESLLFGIFVFLFLIFAIGSYIFPTKYEITEERIKYKLLLFEYNRAWTEFKGYATEPEAILLSPFMRRTFLEKTRGVILNAGDNSKLIELIKSKGIKPLPKRTKNKI